jgi:hypothetical protein
MLVVTEALFRIFMLLQIIVDESIVIAFPEAIIISSALVGMPVGDQIEGEFQFPEFTAVFVEANDAFDKKNININVAKNFIVLLGY